MNFISQFWKEKDKFGKRLSNFEKRKRNGYSFLKFWEEKEISLKISNFEKRQWNLKFLSPGLRREKEIWKTIHQFREEKENFGFCILKSFLFPHSFAYHYVKAKAEKVKVSHSFPYSVRNEISTAIMAIWQLLLHIRS